MCPTQARLEPDAVLRVHEDQACDISLSLLQVSMLLLDAFPLEQAAGF